MDIQQRLAEFFRRLEAAPPVATADEAIALVCRLIEEVEDEFCPAPREDHLHRLPDGTITASTRRHRVVCLRDGAITVIHMTDKSVVFTKPGRTQ